MNDLQKIEDKAIEISPKENLAIIYQDVLSIVQAMHQLTPYDIAQGGLQEIDQSLKEYNKLSNTIGKYLTSESNIELYAPTYIQLLSKKVLAAKNKADIANTLDRLHTPYQIIEQYQSLMLSALLATLDECVDEDTKNVFMKVLGKTMKVLSQQVSDSENMTIEAEPVHYDIKEETPEDIKNVLD